MTEEATQVEELSLDAVLEEPQGEETPEPVAVEPEKVEIPAETPEEPETPSGEKEEPKDQSWHLKAVLDEREKRQSAQRELQELREQLKKAEEGKDRPKTSVFEDEGKFRTEILTELETKVVNDKLNMSQALAEDKWGADVVAAKVEVFKALAKDSPELRAEFREAALPYHAMMRIVERHEKAKKIESLTAPEYEAQLKARIRAEVEAELKGKQDADAAKRESITPSLATKRSEGGVKETTTLIRLDDVLTD